MMKFAQNVLNKIGCEFWTDRRGTASLETAIISATIAIFATSGLGNLSTKISSELEEINSAFAASGASVRVVESENDLSSNSAQAGGASSSSVNSGD